MAVQPGLCGTRSKIPKTGFLTTRPILYQCFLSDTGTIGTAGIVGLAIGVVVFISLVGAGLLVYFNISKKKRKNKIDTILRA